jgi:hypothetical protein
MTASWRRLIFFIAAARFPRGTPPPIQNSLPAVPDPPLFLPCRHEFRGFPDSAALGVDCLPSRLLIGIRYARAAEGH